MFIPPFEKAMHGPGQRYHFNYHIVVNATFCILLQDITLHYSEGGEGKRFFYLPEEGGHKYFSRIAGKLVRLAIFASLLADWQIEGPRNFKF